MCLSLCTGKLVAIKFSCIAFGPTVAASNQGQKACGFIVLVQETLEPEFPKYLQKIDHWSG